MQKHDYELHMDDNGLEIDTLIDKQLLQVAETIKLIKSKEAEEQHLNRIYWFKATILPILQDFAKCSSSSFEMEQDNEGIIAVSFRNPNGIEIMWDSLCIKFALSLATSVTISCDDGESILLLTYDCNRLT